MTFGKTKFEHLMEQQRQRKEKENKTKTHRTCGECKNGKLIDFVCTKKDIAICIDSTCDDFIPKDSIANKLEAAAKKAATTSNRHDLQAYLKLRREML